MTGEELQSADTVLFFMRLHVYISETVLNVILIVIMIKCKLKFKFCKIQREPLKQAQVSDAWTNP